MAALLSDYSRLKHKKNKMLKMGLPPLHSVYISMQNEKKKKKTSLPYSAQSQHQQPCISTSAPMPVNHRKTRQFTGASGRLPLTPPSPRLMELLHKTIKSTHAKGENAERTSIPPTNPSDGNHEQSQTVENFGSHPNQGFDK